MTARPIAALLPTGLPAVTIAELAHFCDGARTVFSGGKHANAALACVTGNRALVREYVQIRGRAVDALAPVAGGAPWVTDGN